MKKNQVIHITTFAEMEYYMDAPDWNSYHFARKSDIKAVQKHDPYTIVVCITDDMYERFTAVCATAEDYDKEALSLVHNLVIAEQRQAKIDALLK